MDVAFAEMYAFAVMVLVAALYSGESGGSAASAVFAAQERSTLGCVVVL